MALLLQCMTCPAVVVTNDGRDPDSLVSCGCCPEDHHHGQAANSCPGGHTGPCLTPDTCPTWTGMAQEGPCPGGHCGKDVSGCTVCRPITITLLPPVDDDDVRLDIRPVT